MEAAAPNSPPKCWRWTNREKASIVRKVKRKVGEGVSIRAACKEMHIIPKQYCARKEIVEDGTLRINLCAYNDCKGPTNILDEVDEELLKFVFELRETGMPVSANMVRVQACMLCREFRGKSKDAQMMSTRRWLKQHSLVHRMGTNESQRDPRETATEALDYIKGVRPLLAQPNCHADFIINMDQTPIFFQ